MRSRLFTAIHALSLAFTAAAQELPPQGTSADGETHILKCLAKPDGSYYCVRVYTGYDSFDPGDIDLDEVSVAETVALTGEPAEVRSFKCGITAHCEIIGTNPRTGEVYIECRCGG
jgi:hypothetical protein